MSAYVHLAQCLHNIIWTYWWPMTTYTDVTYSETLIIARARGLASACLRMRKAVLVPGTVGGSCLFQLALQPGSSYKWQVH